MIINVSRCRSAGQIFNTTKLKRRDRRRNTEYVRARGSGRSEFIGRVRPRREAASRPRHTHLLHLSNDTKTRRGTVPIEALWAFNTIYCSYLASSGRSKKARQSERERQSRRENTRRRVSSRCHASSGGRDGSVHDPIHRAEAVRRDWAIGGLKKKIIIAPRNIIYSIGRRNIS